LTLALLVAVMPATPALAQGMEIEPDEGEIGDTAGSPHRQFEIAVGRPAHHLFGGAVMTYREFRSPITQPLDDEAWRAAVKKGPVPPAPPFTKSFLDDTPVPPPKDASE